MSDGLLRTPRLTLRPATSREVGSLHALWILPGVRRWLFEDEQIPLETAREIVEESTTAWQKGGPGLYVVADGRSPLLGFCGFRQPDPESSPDLVCGIADARCGHGLATEAARAVLEQGFGALGLPRVVASVDEPNLASRRVLAKLGMRCTGRGLVEGRPTLFHELARAEFSGQSSGTTRASGPE